MAEEKKNVVKGCIKASRGPWLVRKTTKTGRVITKLRNPSDRERQNNTSRERKRRSITQKIFAGLKAHGNYQLPKNADTNDLLKALCEEAGWHVEEDGAIHNKNSKLDLTSLMDVESNKAELELLNFINVEFNHDARFEDESYCNCDDKIDFHDVDHLSLGNKSAPLISKISEEGCEIDLTLSLSVV